MYSLEEVIKRYNDGVSDYAAYLVAKNEHRQNEQEQHLRNAGECLSQALEHALKYHVENNAPTVFSKHIKSSTPTVIETFYLDCNGVKKQLFIRTLVPGFVPTVNFDYLRTHKNELTNNAKHSGGQVIPVVVEEYIKQIKLFIVEYLDKKALLRDTSYFMEAQHDQIQQFYVACDHFQREDRTYILLTDKINGVDKRQYRHFSLAPWDYIVDFDHVSLDSGFYAGAYGGDEKVAHIFKTSDVITADDFTSSMRKPIYYYANGFKRERVCSDYDEWNRLYYSKLEKFFQAVSPNLATQKTIVVSLLHDEDYTDNLRSMIVRYFTNVQFVIANDVDDTLVNLTNRKKSSYEHVKSSIDEIGNCLYEYLNVKTNSSVVADTYSLPYIPNEGSGFLSKVELEELQECFEVLYDGIGDGSDEDEETYLRGEVALTWQGVKRNFAVRRGRFQKMYENPLDAKIKKGHGKIYIIHEPGYGGTTVARQLAYAFHESYPVLYLKEYRYKAVVQKLDWLHDRTKKNIVIFMEIPSVISADDFEYLYRFSNQSRPYVFVGVMRGMPKTGDIAVTDWGDDTILLSDKFKHVIEDRYSAPEKDKKLAEISDILAGNVESYKRTPFYFGMLSYEKDFVAANGFFEKFVRVVDHNEKQRKFLIFLSLCDVYADKPLPEALFKTVFGVQKKNIFKIEQYFSEDDGVFGSLVQTEKIENARFIRPKYAFFSEMLLKKLLRKENTPEDIGWTENLGLYCKEFIEDVAHSDVASMLEEEVLQPLFIGSSKERDGEHFTKLVDDIQKEEQVNIFVTLHEHFPENPHFCSHLARYYALMEKNMGKALEYADRAIRLSQTPDPLLHHMKGMCLFYIITDRIDSVKNMIRNGLNPKQEELYYITETLLTQAELEFQKSREIQQSAHHEDEYGYIPNIKLLLRVFDFYVYVMKVNKRDVISAAKEPYVIWLDKAHTLLDNARRLHEEGEESELFLSCEGNLWGEYENYSSLIEKLNNQLAKTSHPALVRRQLAQIYMKRNDDYKTSTKANERILSLMSDNMKVDAKNISNFLLWFRAARYSSLSVDDIITRLAQWNGVNPAIDLSFYLFVFNAIKAIEGSSEAVTLAKKYLQECRSMGGNNRIYVKDWYGKAPQRIISNYELKESPQNYNLYEVTGYVKSYQHPGNAIIELDCGLDVFFKPSVKGIQESSLNHDVRFKLGFSYDGLRADNESIEIIG